MTLIKEQFRNIEVFVRLKFSILFEKQLNINVGIDKNAYDNNLFNSTMTSLINIINLTNSIDNIFLRCIININAEIFNKYLFFENLKIFKTFDEYRLCLIFNFYFPSYFLLFSRVLFS